jgi:hypothetical protein
VNKSALKKLKRRYSEKGLVLALGAGVSQGSDLPSWEELIKRLSDKLGSIEGAPKLVYSALKKAGYGLPAVVGVVEALYSESGSDFAEAIQEQLYLGFPYYKQEMKEENRRAFVKHVGANKTLRAVAAMCAVKAEGAGRSYRRNPRLHAIVTTNVDSVLRTYIRARYQRWESQESELVRTIERPSAGRVYDSIPIYYLHGLIRFDKDVNEVHKHAADLRVFTEQEFFDFFNNPHGLFNYTFLYLLREFSCVFLGMSLKDDNIRRLLHYSKKERFESERHELLGLPTRKQNEKLLKHFKKLPRDDSERTRRLAELADRASRRHFLIDRYPRKKARPVKGSPSPVEGLKDERLAGLIEISLKRLGVNVLWLDDYSDIPKLLRQVYKSTPEGHTWRDVYGMQIP